MTTSDALRRGRFLSLHTKSQLLLVPMGPGLRGTSGYLGTLVAATGDGEVTQGDSGQAEEIPATL